MPRYFMPLNTRPICAQYGNHFPFAFSRRYVGGKSGPCRAVISARVLDRSRRGFVLVPRGSRVPLPIEVLQPSIDRLARTFQLRSDLAHCHSGIKHVSKLLFFRWRPAAPDTFRSRHFPFAFGPLTRIRVPFDVADDAREFVGDVRHSRGAVRRTGVPKPSTK